jgi:hypothetical protein
MWAAVVSVAAAIQATQQSIQTSQSFQTFQQQKQAEQPLVLDVAATEDEPVLTGLDALMAIYKKNQGASTTLAD